MSFEIKEAKDIMTFKINNSDGSVFINELLNGKREIWVESAYNDFISKKSWKTSYSVELIEEILKVKGLKWLCDDIMRDEDPTYTQSDLYFSIMSYCEEIDFENVKILDFGCGSGASAMILSRMFPSADIVGVDLVNETLNIAKSRAKYYKAENVNFMISPSGNKLPKDIGNFDYILLSAVYEHMLPDERKIILNKLWEKLNIGGIIFINQTPDKHFPIETHTTGLPLINYLPDKVTLFLSRKFSKGISCEESWNSLLRSGIRGATTNEIMNILITNSINCEPILLKPTKLGIKKQGDICYKASKKRLSQRYKGSKKIIILMVITFILMMKIPIAPYLSLAIKKVKSS